MYVFWRNKRLCVLHAGVTFSFADAQLGLAYIRQWNTLP